MPGDRRPGQFFGQLLLLAALLAGLPGVARAAWEVTEFKIVIDEPPVNNIVDDWIDETADNVVEAFEELGFGEELTEERKAAEAAWRRQLEGFFGKAAQYYSDQGLKEPTHLRRDQATGRYLIYLFDFGASDRYEERPEVANAGGINFTPDCRGGSGFIAINTAVYSYHAVRNPAGAGARPVDDRDLFSTVAHELFHAVQYRYDWDHHSLGMCRGKHNDALTEGSAHAAAVHVTDQVYKDFLRTTTRSIHLGSYLYAAAFLQASTGFDEYLTSSFWRFLIERYGGLRVYDHLYRTPQRTGGDISAQDAARWLDSALQRSSYIDLPLYLVFPEFVADVATWAEVRYRGKEITESWWWTQLFAGCHQAVLSPEKAVQSYTQPLVGLAADCLQVTVEGLQPGQRVSVKVMAFAPMKADLDGLHLGVARMNSELIDVSGEFHCYRQARERGYHRVPNCLEKPYLGRRDVSSASQSSIEGRIQQQFETTQADGPFPYVKTWSAHDQRWQAGFENVFTLARVQPIPDLSAVDVPYKIEVAIDFGNLESSETGKSHSPDSDINLPGNTNPVPIDEYELDFSNDSVDDLTQMIFLQQGGTQMGRAAMREEVGEGLAVIHFSNRDFDNLDEDELVGADLFTVGLWDGAVPIGTTGKFDIGLSPSFQVGPDAVNQSIISADSDTPDGKLTLRRFDDQLLQGELEIEYCRFANFDFRRERCRKVENVQLEFTKPFGWAYDIGQSFVSVDSPGMRMYRKLSGDLVFGDSGQEWSDIADPDWTPSGDGAGSSATGSQGTSTSGSSGGLCQCTCEEYRELDSMANAMEQESDAGLLPNLSGGGFQRLMQCSSQCRAAYMQCLD